MLKGQTELQFSKYAELYDILIPKDHELRKLLELVDFSFVYDELSNKYSVDEGRTAVDPVQMFKYLYLKVRYNLSDRDLVSRAKTDLAFKFFLGLRPEDNTIHASLLTKFRRQRLKDVDLLNLLIKKTVELALEKGVLARKTLIVDATHTVARYNQKSPVEALRSSAKILRKRLYAVNVKIKQQLPEKNTTSDLEDEQQYVEKLVKRVKDHPEYLPQNGVTEALHSLEEVQDDVESYKKYSQDEDAKVGHKTQDTAFFGYKTHIAMSENQIITGAIITSGEKGDGPLLKELVQQSNANGMDVKEIIGDRAYSGKKNLEYTQQAKIRLISRLMPVITSGQRRAEDNWEFNKDAGMFVCPAGHMAVRKARTGKKNQGKNQLMTYYFDINKCRQCPLQEGCYKPGAKSKSYNVTIKSGAHQAQQDFENTEYFQERVKDRYKIEGKNAELKIEHGYAKSWSKNFEAMTLQGALTLFCVNLKRIQKLTDEK